MNVRLLAGMALPVVAGFALGVATAPGDKTVPTGAAAIDQANPNNKPVSALSGGPVGSAAMLSRVAAHSGAGGFSKLMAYMKLVRQAELGELPELLERIRRDIDGGDISHAEILESILIERWVTEDPLGALAAILEGRPPAMRNKMWAVFPKLVEKHPREGWAAIRSMQHQGQRANWIRNFLQTAAIKHPELTLELLKDLSPVGDRRLRADVLGQVAMKRPLEALAFAESLPVGALGVRESFAFTLNGKVHVSQRLAQSDDEAATLVAKAWVQSDPAAAIAWAEAQSGSRRESVLASTVTEWAASEPEAAMGYAQENFRKRERAQVLDKALQTESLSIDRRRALAETHGETPARGLGYHAFANHWIKQDPAAMGAWFAERKGPDTGELVREAARGWTANDETEAAVRVAEIADPELRGIAVEAVANRIHANGGLGLHGIERSEMAPEVRAALEAVEAETGKEAAR